MSQPLTTELMKAQFAEAKTTLGRQQVLRRLGPRHKLIIALHLKGHTGPQIAKRVGCSIGRVYAVLKDPSAKIVIEHFNEGFETDVKALFPKAIAAISRALDDPDKAMSAVDRYMKLAGKDDHQGQGGVHINILGGARVKLVNELRDAVDRNIVDVTPSKAVAK